MCLIHAVILGVAVIVFFFAPTSLIGNPDQTVSDDLIQPLLSQGVRPGQIIGADDRGVPMICARSENISGKLASTLSEIKLGTVNPTPAGVVSLPASTWMWEAIPGVIRDNGTDTFRLEVNANGPITSAMLVLNQGFASPSGQKTNFLRDDGLQGDRIANDFIFAIDLLRFDTNFPNPVITYYRSDTNSPVGIRTKDLGTVTVTETNGALRDFVVRPQMGILRTNVPLTEVITLSSNIAISAHLINVRGTNLSAQKLIRLGYDTADLTRMAYDVLPDAFDFIVHFSTYHMERLPKSASGNLISGIQRPVRVNFTGTGQGVFNNTAYYGSAGRLLSEIGLDSYDRGVLSYNCAHEILHTWGAFLNALPISDGQAHYNPKSNVGSLLGGHLWTTNANGTWKLICEEGRNGATRIDPLDKYLMGLLDAGQLPLLRVYPDSYPNPLLMCNGTITNAQSTVTSADIVGTYGTRTPGPTTAQRNFSIGFIAESNERLLNPVEMTFYEILASHFTKTVQSGQPDPYVGMNWSPITRFFGTDTTWKSDVLTLIRPTITRIERLPNGNAQVTGTGYPGWNYRLLRSTNSFGNWATVTNRTAGTNGTFALVDTLTVVTTPRFYRVATP